MKINGHQNLKYIKKKILFCGRKNDRHSIKFLNFLKKKNFVIKYILKDSKKKITKKESNIIYSNYYDFIFSFRSHILIDTNRLSKKCIPINFHPGPPKYRGIGCINFALLNKEKYYGATAHIMKKKIDNGPILNYKKFKISNDSNIEKVLDKTYKVQLNQFKKLVNQLLDKRIDLENIIKKNKKIKWSSKLYKKKKFDEII